MMLKRLTADERFQRLHRFVSGEAAILAVIALASGLILIFLRLADEVVEGETAAFDKAVLLLFRTPGNVDQVVGPLWVQEMVRDVTALGSFACLGLLVLGVVIYLMLAGTRGAALLVAVSVLGGTALSTVLKMGYDRPRPDLAHASHLFTASFPSGHAMLSAVTFLTLGAILAKMSSRRSLRVFYIGTAIFLTGIVGVSRLYLGVHYPTDVLAGWCLGAAWAILCSIVATILQRAGTVQAPAMPKRGQQPGEVS